MSKTASKKRSEKAAGSARSARSARSRGRSLEVMGGGERLARLEADRDHLATKADLVELKTDISRIEESMKQFATKGDIKDLRIELKGDIKDLKIWILSGIIGTSAAALGIVFGLTRFLG